MDFLAFFNPIFFLISILLKAPKRKNTLCGMGSVKYFSQNGLQGLA